MKYLKYATPVILLMLDGVMPSLASDQPPFAGPCAVMDRIAAAAGNARTKAVAVDSLEEVASVRAGQIGAEAEAALGVEVGMFQSKEFANPTVRACALRSMGRTALDEAVDFLAKLAPGDLGSDPSQMVWPAAQIALRDAQLRRITDPYAKTEFLERAVAEPHDAVSNSAVTSWAVNELCDRGAQTSLPVIQQSIRKASLGQRGEDEIEFCEARIRVVMSNPDRVKALASILTVRADAADTRLVGWAVNELNSMQTPTADAELDRFAREIEGLPEGSPAKESLGIYMRAILMFQVQRVK